MGARDRGGAPRPGTSVPRAGIILVAVLLLGGCRTSDVADGTAGVDGTGGSHVVLGEDGADGSPGIGRAVTGSGYLTSRELNLSGVTELAVGASFVVRVRIGEPEQARIWMDDNLADLVDATVQGGRLRLGLTPGANVRNATLVAEITVRELGQLTASGASQVTLAPELTGDRLGLEASGASQITGRLRVEVIVASVAGASTLALSGQVGQLNLHAAGTSGLRLSGLAVRNLDAELSGASCAAVAVSATLAARTSGASVLRYSGAPRITRAQTSGTSSIAPDAARSDPCGA